MQYCECECGEAQSWTSGEMPPPCMPCSKCGTVPGHPSCRQAPVPHKFEAVYKVETDEGTKNLTHCVHCHYTRRQLEKMGRLGLSAISEAKPETECASEAEYVDAALERIREWIRQTGDLPLSAILNAAIGVELKNMIAAGRKLSEKS